MSVKNVLQYIQIKMIEKKPSMELKVSHFQASFMNMNVNKVARTAAVILIELQGKVTGKKSRNESCSKNITLNTTSPPCRGYFSSNRQEKRRGK